MSTFEVEVKSLLGEEARACHLRDKMAAFDPNFKRLGGNRQLNHYFESGDVKDLADAVAPHLSTDQMMELHDLIDRGNSFSVRTRQKDNQILLVVKASIDEGTSANTISRREFERPVSLTLTELDQVVLEAGFQYQAKWSREREEYSYKGLTVCLDKNAGYGYLAEFEKVVDDESAVLPARAEIGAVMQELGVQELSQDRLERMFAYYNQNWPEYYGTEKVFLIQ